MRHLSNQRIAAVLREMAAFYEAEGVGFKPDAYARAAASIAILGDDVADIYADRGKDGLTSIDGVGEGIAKHIVALLEKGTFPEYARFKKRYPIDIAGLTSVEDVGPKTAKKLYETLGIRTLAQLERAAKAGKIHGIKGFGARSEQQIRQNVRSRRGQDDRKLLGEILPLAREIESALRAIPGVRHAAVAGSVRRRQETIGDLDFIVTASDRQAVMEGFGQLPQVARITERGEMMTVARLENGMRCDVRIVDDESFGAALLSFTGDTNHNIILRKMAVEKGLKLNDYGIWKGKTLLATRTEEDVYRVLGLPYMDPEIRTASGEIEAALAGKLPKLIEYGALKGDLQVQSDWTDGRSSISEMAEAARALGLEYIAITDHTRALAMTGGLDEKELGRQGKEIDRLNESYHARRIAFRILKGAEVNILKDGRLDVTDAALAKLDFVGASVHSHFRLDREAQTSRIARAMTNPHVDAIFHPTGRKIGRREPIDVDMASLLRAAKVTGTAMEINAYPDRCDLKDVHVRMATAMGVKLIIDSDAHRRAEFDYLDLGVAIARRGWARKTDVLNTLPYERLMARLRLPKQKR
jgi:DNA polymerase (family 10)